MQGFPELLLQQRAELGDPVFMAQIVEGQILQARRQVTQADQHRQQVLLKPFRRCVAVQAGIGQLDTQDFHQTALPPAGITQQEEFGKSSRRLHRRQGHAFLIVVFSGDRLLGAGQNPPLPIHPGGGIQVYVYFIQLQQAAGCGHIQDGLQVDPPAVPAQLLQVKFPGGFNFPLPALCFGFAHHLGPARADDVALDSAVADYLVLIAGDDVAIVNIAFNQYTSLAELYPALLTGNFHLDFREGKCQCSTSLPLPAADLPGANFQGGVADPLQQRMDLLQFLVHILLQPGLFAQLLYLHDALQIILTVHRHNKSRLEGAQGFFQLKCWSSFLNKPGRF